MIPDCNTLFTGDVEDGGIVFAAACTMDGMAGIGGPGPVRFDSERGA